MDAQLMDYQKTTDPFPVSNTAILLLEDDKSTREALQFFLRYEGFSVKAVDTLAEAQAFLTKRKGPNMAVIISDMHLDPISKELEGYVLLIHWVAAESDLPFILINGEQTVWDLPLDRRDKALYLAKPFTLRGLLSAVQLLLIE